MGVLGVDHGLDVALLASSPFNDALGVDLDLIHRRRVYPREPWMWFLGWFKKSDNAQDSDETLMLRFQKGDQRAFATLYDRYDRRLRGYVASLGAARPDDVVQDAFTKVIHKAHLSGRLEVQDVAVQHRSQHRERRRPPSESEARRASTSRSPPVEPRRSSTASPPSGPRMTRIEASATNGWPRL